MNWIHRLKKPTTCRAEQLKEYAPLTVLQLQNIVSRSFPNMSDSPFTVAWCSSIYVSELNTIFLTLSLVAFDHLHISEMMATNGINPFYMHVKESEQPFECHVHTPILIRCVITILRGLLPLSRLAMGMELSCMLLCETHSSHVRKTFSHWLLKRDWGAEASLEMVLVKRNSFLLEIWSLFRSFTVRRTTRRPLWSLRRHHNGLRFAQESVDGEYAAGGCQEEKDSSAHLGSQIQL